MRTIVRYLTRIAGVLTNDDHRTTNVGNMCVFSRYLEANTIKKQPTVTSIPKCNSIAISGSGVLIMWNAIVAANNGGQRMCPPNATAAEYLLWLSEVEAKRLAPLPGWAAATGRHPENELVYGETAYRLHVRRPIER